MAVLVACCQGALAFTAISISVARSSATSASETSAPQRRAALQRRHRARASAGGVTGAAGEAEDFAAKRACSRLSDSHVAAFQKDGFVALRQGVPLEFEAYLAAVQQHQGVEGALQELARRTPPRALVGSLAGEMRLRLYIDEWLLMFHGESPGVFPHG